MFFMMTGFIGYVITWGQMSFWGGTVITNILSIIPCSIAWMCGGFYVSNPTLKRFFIYHLILSILCNGIVIIHLYYLHYISNTNPLGYNINNFITFYPYILYKDIYRGMLYSKNCCNFVFTTVGQILFSRVPKKCGNRAFWDGLDTNGAFWAR